MAKQLTLVVRNVDPTIYRAFKAKVAQQETAVGPALTRAMALYLSRALLLDASVLVAARVPEDPHHAAARQLLRSLPEAVELYASDFLFDECVTVALARSKQLETAIAMGESIRNSEISIIHPVEELLEESWWFFRTRNPGRMSFTDCTTVVLAKRLGNLRIATFDREFTKVPGLRVVGC